MTRQKPPSAIRRLPEQLERLRRNIEALPSHVRPAFRLMAEQAGRRRCAAERRYAGHTPFEPVGSDAAPAHPPDCRVLLVEDNADLQRLISLMLELAGVHVIGAADGKEAVQLLCAPQPACEPFDVVLMDIQMPMMDGHEATRELRRRGYTRPIVALTAYAMPGDRQACLDAGCDDYATKPIERASLIALVAKWAAVARAAMEDACHPPVG